MYKSSGVLFLTIFFLLFFFTFSYSEKPSKIITINENSYNQDCKILENCFSPSIIKISSGDFVKWVNEDSSIHNVIGIDQKNNQNIFSSPNLTMSETFEFQFMDDNSIFSYFCNIHPWMIGYVLVGNVELNQFENPQTKNMPLIFDDFKYEEFITDLVVPISIDFIDDTMFILQKNDGKVIKYDDGKKTTILDLEVSNYGEQGLLGITTVDNYVYLFLSEAYHDGGLALGNKVYKFYWNGETLIEKELLHEFPADTISYNGGVLVTNNLGYVFAITGESYKAGVLQNHEPHESFRPSGAGSRADSRNNLDFFDSIKDIISCTGVSFKEKTSNPYGYHPEKISIDNKLESNPLYIIGNIEECIQRFFYNEFSFGYWKDTSVILQVDPPGEYIAIGIRNSFGMAVDPVTGNLWNSENGPDKFDEINLIEKKFNSGWSKVMGPSEKKINSPKDFIDFEYSDPEFSWERPVGVTGMDFANSTLFNKYKNWLFVADSNNGNIYKFKLNEDRNEFIFTTRHLQDKVVNLLDDTNESTDEIIFGSNFGLISDIKFGPDGALYVVSLRDGIIYRITPN